MLKLEYQKLNIIIIATCLVLVAFLSVGYSLLSQELNVSSAVNVRVDADVRVMSLSVPTLTSGAYEQYNSRYTENSLVNNVVLPNLDSTATYTATITNNSSGYIKISNIVADVFSNNAMTYSFDGVTIGTIINPETTISFTILFNYKSSTSTIPDDTMLGSILVFSFTEYNPESLVYETSGLLLKLDGTDEPVDGNWVDTDNNHTITLTNVTYDSTNHLYDFSANGQGTLGAAIIPETGDFTLEAYIVTPASIASSSVDEAIVSQLSNTASSDSGRFKLNLRNTGLLAFINTQTNGSQSIYYTTGVSTSTKYLLQLVRSGSSLLLYLNGSLITTNSYNATDTISQGPFKLGWWNNSTNQQYTGSIMTVRLYNRALAAAELLNNYNVDNSIYNTTTSNTVALYDYAIANQVVTSGSGLYNIDTDTYLYKGLSVTNNYVQFYGDSAFYRLVGFYTGGLAKLVRTTTSSDNLVAFSTETNRDASTSTYCASASSKGCNYFATTSGVTLASDFTWNGGSVITDSTLKAWLDNWYTTLDTSISSKIVSHDFEMGFIDDTATYDTAISESANIIYTGNVGLLTVVDVLKASLTPLTALQTSINVSDNYLVASLGSLEQAWTMNGSTGDTWDVWCIAYGTQLSRKKASRTSQTLSSGESYFYALPTIYVSDSVNVTGTGSAGDPFIIQN